MNITRIGKALLITALCSLISFTHTANADWLYVIDRSADQLIRINPDSQQSEMIGSLGFNYRYGSMVWHPDFNSLLLVTDAGKVESSDPTVADFYWVDPSTAKSTFIGTLNFGIEASLSAYGITIDDQKNIFVSFTNLETRSNELWEIGLSPLDAQFTLNMGSVGGEVDNLEYDPLSGLLLGVATNVGADPASVYSIDSSINSVERKCEVKLPENLSEIPGRGLNNGGLTYDLQRGMFWHVNLDDGPLLQLNLGSVCSSNPIPDDSPKFISDAIAYVPLDLEDFALNSGLNDAWYDPDTDGQGFFITVFPDLALVSLAWFTYDTELPPEDATANLGDPGHRWLTALGPIEGNQVLMNIDIASGGIFDTATDIQHTDPPGSDGTIILTFDSCNSGTVEYDITSIDRQGIVPIRRVVDDNIVICEALKAD